MELQAKELLKGKVAASYSFDPVLVTADTNYYRYVRASNCHTKGR